MLCGGLDDILDLDAADWAVLEELQAGGPGSVASAHPAPASCLPPAAVWATIREELAAQARVSGDGGMCRTARARARARRTHPHTAPPTS